MNTYIIDFDDFSEEKNGLNYLFQLKARIPNFKCTLFCIPAKISEQMLYLVKELSWLELAVHGYEHTPAEALKWRKQDAMHSLAWAEKYGYTKLFKAPGWELGDGTVEALKEFDWMLADNPTTPSYNKDRIKDIPHYFAHTGFICQGVSAGNMIRIHGHIGVYDTSNDISQLFPSLLSLENGEFLFVSEVINRFYVKS